VRPQELAPTGACCFTGTTHREANLIHAREMKALNVDREIIKKVTGIDIDTIE